MEVPYPAQPMYRFPLPPVLKASFQDAEVKDVRMEVRNYELRGLTQHVALYEEV